MIRRSAVYALVFLLAVPLAARETIMIATPGFDHPTAIVAREILPAAYTALGFDVEFAVLPPSRALAYFDDGAVDAFIFSDSHFIADRPGAVPVRPAIGNDDIVVFSMAPLKIEGWLSLRHLAVGHLVGMHVVERGLASVPGIRAEPAQDMNQAFQKLQAGRSDAVVVPRGAGLMAVKDLRFTDIRVLDPPLEAVPLYHYLGPRRASLAQALSTELRRLADSGRLRDASRRAEAGFQR